MRYPHTLNFGMCTCWCVLSCQRTCHLIVSEERGRTANILNAVHVLQKSCFVRLRLWIYWTVSIQRVERSTSSQQINADRIRQPAKCCCFFAPLPRTKVRMGANSTFTTNFTMQSVRHEHNHNLNLSLSISLSHTHTQPTVTPPEVQEPQLLVTLPRRRSWEFTRALTGGVIKWHASTIRYSASSHHSSRITQFPLLIASKSIKSYLPHVWPLLVRTIRRTRTFWRR